MLVICGNIESQQPVKVGATKNFYSKKNTSVILGTMAKKEALLKKLPDKKIRSSSTDYNSTKTIPTIDHVSQVCAEYFNLMLKDIVVSRRGYENLPRMIGIYGSRVWASGKLESIAKKYGCQSHGLITNTVKKVSERMRVERKFGRMVSDIHERVIQNNKCQMNT